MKPSQQNCEELNIFLNTKLLTMKSTMQNTETLNDLIEINNDRVEGYNKASEETNDQDLRSLFSRYAAQSSQFASELRQHVMEEGEEPEEGTTFRGKIYRAWMDIKDKFAGKNDRKSVLSSCEFGEDAAQRAYNSALEDDELTSDVRSLIEQQKATLKEAHDQIKNLRDAQKS
jgi:uncharacterized protein (TIGR02284 family)